MVSRSLASTWGAVSRLGRASFAAPRLWLTLATCVGASCVLPAYEVGSGSSSTAGGSSSGSCGMMCTGASGTGGSSSSTSASTSSTSTSTSGSGGAAGGPITRVQTIYPMKYVEGTTLSATIAQTAGNTLVVAALQQLAGTTVTVTDTKSSTWHALASYGNSMCGTANGHYSGSQIWYANDIASGSNTVTLTVNGSMTYLWLVVVEYAGVNPADPVSSDGVVASTSTTAMSAGAVMTTAAHSLVVGLFHDTYQADPMTAGPGFTKLAEELQLDAMLEDNVDVPPGSATATALATGQADDCWVATAAAFEAN